MSALEMLTYSANEIFGVTFGGMTVLTCVLYSFKEDKEESLYSHLARSYLSCLIILVLAGGFFYIKATTSQEDLLYIYTAISSVIAITFLWASQRKKFKSTKLLVINGILKLSIREILKTLIAANIFTVPTVLITENLRNINRYTLIAILIPYILGIIEYSHMRHRRQQPNSSYFTKRDVLILLTITTALILLPTVTKGTIIHLFPPKPVCPGF
jgi:hypothetical protein